MEKINRNALLVALYQTDSKSELLEQFSAKLTLAKGTKAKKYTYLLEQIVYFSHAIIFGHGVQTAHNYRQSFMTTAKEHKTFKLEDSEIEEAFSFLNRTPKKMIKRATITEPTTTQKTEITVSSECVAKDEIKRFKAQLDTKSYELKKGQLSDDKETYIKIAILSLSIGADQSDILKNIDLESFKAKNIVELNTKVVKRYIREVREHYTPTIRVKKLQKQIEANPKDKNLQKALVREEAKIGKDSVDVTSAIRRAMRGLGVINATNTRGMIELHNDCLKTESK